jgi:nicotinamidase-related amidase
MITSPSFGSTPANSWRLNDGAIDTTRPPHEPRPLRLAAEPRDVIIDLARSAFISIDMQNDFCSPGGLCDATGRGLEETRKPIAPMQRLVPALRDAGVPIVWVNWGNRPDRLNLSPALLWSFDPDSEGVGIGDPLPGGAGNILTKDSPSAALVPELETAPGDIFVDKYRLSGFWDTPLDSILRNLRIDTLLFAGVNADQCVMGTMIDAHFLGFDTLLLKDCTATGSPRYCWDATLYNAKLHGFVVESEAIVAGLE